ncbi:hypothetical protein EJB05_00751, partial [Eragrostis curvula]
MGTGGGQGVGGGWQHGAGVGGGAAGGELAGWRADAGERRERAALRRNTEMGARPNRGEQGGRRSSQRCLSRREVIQHTLDKLPGPADSRQRRGHGHREPHTFFHVDVVSNHLPLEALNQRRQRQGDEPQSQALAGAPPPAEPERQHGRAGAGAVHEPLRPELLRRVPEVGVPVDRPRVDKDHSAAPDGCDLAVDGDGAVLHGLVRRDDRADGAETEGLLHHGLKVREVRHVCLFY